MKIHHERHGMLNEDRSEIVSYVHERHSIGECQWCDFIRVENITHEFIRRMDEVGDVRHLYMWSLGSSLKDTDLNRRLILKRWRIFSKRMFYDKRWSPVFRILEVGRRGFLHFHVVCIRWIDHAVILRAWRALTLERSNVHVSGYKGKLEPRRLAGYLMKYLGKSSSQYRWMGAFFGKNRDTCRKVSNAPVRAIQHYGGLCYGGYDSIAVVEKVYKQREII